MGGICPLFFDGAVCRFEELPLPENTLGIGKVYKYMEELRSSQKPAAGVFFSAGEKRVNNDSLLKKVIKQIKTWLMQ